MFFKISVKFHYLRKHLCFQFGFVFRVHVFLWKEDWSTVRLRGVTQVYLTPCSMPLMLLYTRIFFYFVDDLNVCATKSFCFYSGKNSNFAFIYSDGSWLSILLHSSLEKGIPRWKNPGFPSPQSPWLIKKITSKPTGSRKTDSFSVICHAT